MCALYRTRDRSDHQTDKIRGSDGPASSSNTWCSPHQFRPHCHGPQAFLKRNPQWPVLGWVLVGDRLLFILNPPLDSDSRNSIQVEGWPKSNRRMRSNLSQVWRPYQRSWPYDSPLPSNRCPVLQSGGLVMTCHGRSKTRF